MIFIEVWMTVSSSLQNSSEYFNRSQQYCGLVSLKSKLNFHFLQFIFQVLRDYSRASTSINITVSFMFHNFFSSLARSRYLSSFSQFVGTAKSTTLFSFYYLKLDSLFWPECGDLFFISKSHRILPHFPLQILASPYTIS